MDRVETLCNLLSEKIRNKVSVQELLLTVKMLESELLHIKNNDKTRHEGHCNTEIKVSKLFDRESNSPEKAEEDVEEKDEEKDEEKTVEVLQIDEADVAAELEEIKKIEDERNSGSHHPHTSLIFEAEDEIPTLAARNNPAEVSNVQVSEKNIFQALPVHPVMQVNEVFKKPEVIPDSDEDSSPVKDLKKAISTEDQKLYINELFRGDEAMYERSMKTINGFSIYPEAEFWIRRELKLKLAWSDKDENVRRFDQLVRRRFS